MASTGQANDGQQPAALNASDAEHAMRMVEGTARSMGLTVEG